jgi:hypothetical protein
VNETEKKCVCKGNVLGLFPPAKCRPARLFWEKNFRKPWSVQTCKKDKRKKNLLNVWWHWILALRQVKKAGNQQFLCVASAKSAPVFLAHLVLPSERSRVFRHRRTVFRKERFPHIERSRRRWEKSINSFSTPASASNPCRKEKILTLQVGCVGEAYSVWAPPTSPRLLVSFPRLVLASRSCASR